MKKYIKKSLFTILAVSLICTMFNVSLTQGVNAAETPDPNVEGLELKKTATLNDDGTYKLQLEAYAKGTLEVITKSKPLDIVMVLDQSRSMTESIGTAYYEAYFQRTTPGHEVLEDADVDSAPHYIKKNDKYIRVRFKYTIEETIFTRFPIYMDNEGNAYAPMRENGKPQISDTGKEWKTVQFYRGFPDHSTSVKMEVLKDAATNFVNSVAKNGGDHRIAMVGYASGNKDDKPDETSYINTELFIGGMQYSINDSKVDGGSSGTQEPGINEMYSQAFQSTTDTTGKNNLVASIGALSANGATRSDLGMEMAKNIFTEDTNTESGREKVVIMFTDGTPTDTNVFSEKVANRAIEIAHDMKKEGTKVFTVGVEEALDVTADPSQEKTSEINKYMQYVSSNYPNATSLIDGGEGDYKGKKFLSADDEKSLLEVFKTISEEISSSTVTLDKETQLVDFVSDYFEVISKENIKVFTQDYAGENGEGKPQWEELVEFTGGTVEFKEDKKEISVSGFDYSQEYIASNNETVRGKRLVLQIDVKLKDGFIGGNDVPTNKDTAGIYDKDGTLVEKFDIPKDNIDLNFEATANDKSVYVATKTGLTEDIFDADLKASGVQYKLNENSYGFDGINNAFVDVVYKVKVGDKVIATYSVKAGETEGKWTDKQNIETFKENTYFTIIAEVSHKNETSTALEKEKSAIINVFTPVVNTEDSTIFKGETVNLKDHVKSVTWVSEDGNAPKPLQDEPVIVYEFTGEEVVAKPDALKLNKTTMYSISMKNSTDKNIDYADYAKFENLNKHKDDHFRVNVVSGELEIVKNIDAQYTNKKEINAEQSFKFKIERRDAKDGEVKDTYYQTIQFSANEGLTSKSIVLKGLSKGYYTVTEMSDWSWKYDEIEDKRNDNYIGNGTDEGNTENSSVYIGDADEKHTDGKLYYGSANGTLIDGVDQSNPAEVNFLGRLNKFIVGDAASAINKFKGNSTK